MNSELIGLYLLSPLHTGGTTQEGNVLGIARESHMEFPYLPSSTIRGRLRSLVRDKKTEEDLFGPELAGSNQLTQGAIWIGDGSLLWLPVPSLSHGVIWVTCPILLQRYRRFVPNLPAVPAECSTSLPINKPIYLKDAILKNNLKSWAESDWKKFIPSHPETAIIKSVLVLPDRYFSTVTQMSLWRQVKVKLKENKTVQDGSFRYEEAIPPDAVMYFPWGTTIVAQQSKDVARSLKDTLKTILDAEDVLQIGGQESLGRGFVQHWSIKNS